MAGPTDPFANLAAARKAPPSGPTFQMPPTMVEKHKKNYADVAANSVDGLNTLGELIADKGSACADLTSIYGSQKEILNNQVAMAAMGIGAGTKLGLLDDALKAGKVEEKFKATGAALHKRCPE